MKKRCLALICAMFMFISGMSVTYAESVGTTEYVKITTATYSEDFNDYTTMSAQNSLVDIDGQGNKVLALCKSGSDENQEKITFDDEITQNIIELEFKMLPRETDSEKAEAYIQLMSGSSTARLNAKITSNFGDGNRYKVKIGSEDVISADDLYHLPYDSEEDNGNFTAQKFNKIKFVMERVVTDNAVDTDASKLYVYLNDVLKGTYTFADCGISYAADKKIESVRVRQYGSIGGSLLERTVYFDDISVKVMEEVAYNPSELQMDFSASMNYEGANPTLVIANGTDSVYLGQSMKLSLIDAQDDSEVAEIAETNAEKTNDSKAVFSFSEEVSVEPGWYYAKVKRFVSGEEKGSEKQQKIYVATTAQLSALPGDFSDLPESDSEAQAKIEYYLPCFLSEEEINELLPKEEDVLTQKASENLSFITAYFKSSTQTYTTIPQVQTAFNKAKGYLDLKNAVAQGEVKSVLQNGGYLDEYIENEVFVENEAEFFTHFEVFRADSENPLVTDEAIEDALYFSIAMTALNAAQSDEIQGVVEAYNNDVFGLDLTMVTEDNADILYPALYNKSYTAVSQVQEDWNEAVAALPEDDGPETSDTEYAGVTKATYTEDFNANFSLASSHNSLVSLDESGNKALTLSRSDGDNAEKIELSGEIAEDIVELEFKLLPRETDSTSTEAYVLLVSGDTARLNIKISSTSNPTNRYRIKIGNITALTTDEIYHLPYNSAEDNGNFTADKFNKIKIVIDRTVSNDSVDNSKSYVHVYLNDLLKGSYTFSEIGSGISYDTDKSINGVKLRQFNDSGRIVYIDDILVSAKEKVAYNPSELAMSFDASMNYEGTNPRIVIADGTDSVYLEQSVRLSLIDAEDDTAITEIAADSVTQAENGAVFSLSEEVSVEPGWYYADVQRYIGGVKKGSGYSRKIYVPSAAQLVALPGDFSDLPESDSEAQTKIQYYLPCFLTEEEINGLFPTEGDVLTQEAGENLSFITAYFKETAQTYGTISQVQTEFMKAKGYLELDNATTWSQVRTVLEKGGYLTDYIDEEVFTANEGAFSTHFEKKRSESLTPLISDASINSALRYAMAMTSLNAAKRSGVQNVVEKYNDVFGLDLSEITEDNADSVYPALYNNSYTDISQITKDWTAAISEIPDIPQSVPEEEEKDYTGGSGGGSSGGGFGGGSGGGTSSGIKTNTDADTTPKIEPTDIEAASNAVFSDIEGHWAQAQITLLYEKKIITGYEDNTFRAANTLTRAELAAMLARILPDSEATADITFADVSENDWYYSAVKKAYSAGIIEGSDGKFSPNDAITREQLAVMIYRALEIKEEVTEDTSYSDSAEISEYAREAIRYLSSKEILSGYEDNTIRPKNTANRAEAAKLLCSLLDVLSK